MTMLLDRFERHLLFGKIYAQTVEDFTMSNCMYNKDTQKTGTARRLTSFPLAIAAVGKLLH